MDGAEACSRPPATRFGGESELSGWRGWCRLHSERYPSRDFERDLAPAFRYGLRARSDWRDRFWNIALEREMAQEWSLHCGNSRLSWAQARDLVRHGFEGFRGERRACRPAPSCLTPVRRAARPLWTRWWNRLCGLPT